MDNKEYTYNIDKYIIGVDENGEDGIGLTVAKIENGEIHFLGNCYGENATCLDLLIKENQELKKQLEERTKMYQNAYNYSQKMESEAIILEAQQKEFIKYLEDEIESCKLTSNLIFNYNKEMKVYKEILQKYKEIIGAEK